MAYFKIARGLESELPTTKKDGQAYFCTDTGSLYIDYKINESISDIQSNLERKKISEEEINNIMLSIQEQINNKLSLSGGTMTGEIKIGQGDGKGIQLGTNGRINATVGSNTAATMFGVSNGIYYLGHSGFATTMRGSKTRPTYNGNNMALYSDITSVSNELENKMPNVAVTTSDNGKFLRVVDGVWAAVAIPAAEEANF